MLAGWEHTARGTTNTQLRAHLFLALLRRKGNRYAAATMV
jgi:hypothetical protein